MARTTWSATQIKIPQVRRYKATLTGPSGHKLPSTLGDLVRNMTELLEHSLGPTIHIETHFPLRLKPVPVDANQLELALLNLAINARDAMPEGGVLTIAASGGGVERPASLDSGNFVRIAVCDSGTGMDADTLSKAVEPFFTTKGIGRGTGLGLSMIHGFAEQSGGKLKLASEPGQGTTAELWLPVAGDSADALSTLEEPPAESPPVTGGLTVLVVDDDPLVLMNTAAMLEDLGHEVVEAASGQEALCILRQDHRVSLLISDHLMPGMTGAQLVHAVSAEFPSLPAILATGYAQLSEAVKPSVPTLTKPFSQHDLARAVAAVTSLADARRVIPFRAR